MLIPALFSRKLVNLLNLCYIAFVMWATKSMNHMNEWMNEWMNESYFMNIWVVFLWKSHFRSFANNLEPGLAVASKISLNSYKRSLLIVWDLMPVQISWLVSIRCEHDDTKHLISMVTLFRNGLNQHSIC